MSRARVPKIVAWMLAHPSRARAARGGAAAAARPGRWNVAGQRAIYAYPSLAMPVLDAVALAGSLDAIRGFRAFRVSFSEALVSRPLLPPDPSSDGALDDTRETGRFWFSQKVTPVMAVPSHTLPGEEIYVIDPDHPQFHRVHFEAWRTPPILARPRPSPGSRAALPPGGGA